MADPVTASIVQAGLKSAGNFLKDELIKRIFGSIFGGGGSDLPPLTPEQQAALEVSNALNMGQGDLYGDGQNEGFLETVGPTFEEAVRKVQALDDSEEKTDLLSVLANNAPYDFTDLTPASITNLEEDDLSNPLLAPNPLLVEQAANTGPKPLDELSPKEIMEVYKDRKIDDLIKDFPTDEGGQYPFEFVRSILINSANEGDKNAAQILMNSGVPIAGSAQQGTTGVGDLGDVLSGDDVVTPTNNTEPKVTGRRTEPKVEVATETIPPSTMPTVSTGSVLDQTGTGDVKVDDQPAGLLNIPTSIPKQPEKKAGMIIEIAQSTPIVETVFDDILFEPRFTRLDNIPDFNLPSGLLRTLV